MSLAEIKKELNKMNGFPITCELYDVNWKKGYTAAIVKIKYLIELEEKKILEQIDKLEKDFHRYMEEKNSYSEYMASKRMAEIDLLRRVIGK